MRPNEPDELNRWKAFARHHEILAKRYRNQLMALNKAGSVIPTSALAEFEPLLQQYRIEALHLSRTSLSDFITDGEPELDSLREWLEENSC